MEKGYRTLKCNGDGCNIVLRISITVAQYGKTLEVKCKCGTKNRVAIPTPPIERQTFGDSSTENIFEELFGKKKK